MKLLINILILIFFNFTVSVAEEEKLNSFVKTRNVEIVQVLENAEVYPNPAEDFIYLRINDKSLLSEVKIEVMSIIGNKMTITYEEIDSDLYKINLNRIPVGNYYVMITVESEKSLKKFLKK